MARIEPALSLLLCGLMVIGCSIQTTEARARYCPLYCLDFEYMTCNSTGNKSLPGVCNCCFATQKGKGCTIYLRNGGVQKCS